MRRMLIRSVVSVFNWIVTVPLVWTVVTGYGPVTVSRSLSDSPMYCFFHTWSPTLYSCLIRLAFSRCSRLSTCSCLLRLMAMMSAIRGMSRNMSLENASAPGEWKWSEELQAHRQACMAVARVSSITALPSCTDRGFLEWTMDLNTCPMV